MSQSFRPSRRTRAACLLPLAAVVVAGAAPAASAATTKLAYTCKLPVVGPVATTLTVETSETILNGVPSSPYKITGLDFANAGSLSARPLEVLAGSKLDSWVVPEDLGVPETHVDIALAGTVPSVTGVAPDYTFKWADPTDKQAGFGRLNLNLRASQADGTPIPIRPLTTDIDGQPITDSDGKPETFDGSCKAVSTAGITFQVHFADPIPPTNPGPITIDLTETTATLHWGASTDNVGVSAYYVVLGLSPRVVAGDKTSLTLTALEPDEEYQGYVQAGDAGGQYSGKTPFKFKTPGVKPPLQGDLSYTLWGSASVPSLFAGAMSLDEGKLDLSFKGTTGAFTGRLTLPTFETTLTNTTGAPRSVKAKVAVVSAGKVKGTVLGGVLKANSKLRFKVLETTIMGSIPVAAGNACQTKRYSDVNWTSVPGVAVKELLDMKAQFDVSDLNGCSPFGGLVSSSTASSGNTIDLSAFLG